MPTPLKPGDKIAILSPASIITPDYVAGAVATLTEMGFNPVVMPSTLAECGSFAGTPRQRLDDLTAALRDPSVKAILCSRGGYGCVHLLPELDRVMAEPQVAANPKWLIGFSDVSALHALWWKHGIPSVHASMAKQLALGGPSDPLNRSLIDILQGKISSISLPVSRPAETIPGQPEPSPKDSLPLSEEAAHLPEETAPILNQAKTRPGEAEGELVGGNLAVLGGLIGTPYSPIRPGSILLIEDIAEPIYKVERILWQLRLAGIFDNLAGLIVGEFTDYRHPTADHPDMHTMIARFAADTNFPIAMGVPVGHIDANRPILLNRPARLEVTPSAATITY